MRKVMKKSTRFFTLSLCIALLFTNALFLAPVVGAASDTTKTETENSNNDISSAEDTELTLRAIAIDEARKEAQVAVDEQLAIIALEENEEETEAPQEETEAPTEEATEASDEKAEDTASSDESAESSSTTEEEDSSSSDSDGSSAAPASGYLMGIDNPDPSYSGRVVSMSAEERDYCERMVMGEAGDTGYTGMALVAQCIRDTYVAGNYSSVADVIASNGYYGSTDITPSATCKEVVSYIFDQGGSAVQHRIQVFYASDICSSPWHESQNFVCAYGYQRFFDCY